MDNIGKLINLGNLIICDSTLETDNVLIAPLKYIVSTGGKGIQQQIITILSDFFEIEEKYKITITEIIQGLHNCSLIIDDVMDYSTKRRGYDCAHLLYGMLIAINAGYLYILKLIRKAEYSFPKCASITSVLLDDLVNLHRGQSAEIF